MTIHRSLNEPTTVDYLAQEIVKPPAALRMFEGSRREMRLVGRLGRPCRRGLRSKARTIALNMEADGAAESPCGHGAARNANPARAEAIRPCTPQGALFGRHWPTRSTSARQRIRHGLRHTAALAGRRPRQHVPNERFRHVRIYELQNAIEFRNPQDDADAA